VLLPLSLDEERFDDPANERLVGNALAVLDQSSKGLERHGASEDVGFALLARTLSIEARDVRLRYDTGHRREARYLIQTMTETCVACHSRLPSGNAPRSDAFVREVAVLDLPIEQRAKLAYATRQFDAALDLYEQMLRSKEFSANDLDMGGYLDDYLELAIRVRRDLERPAATMEQFAGRDDLTPVLRGDVSSWITALRDLAGREPATDPIAAARELVAGDGAQIEADRVALVQHLYASGQLHRALATGLARPERAEAYYLLGLIETRIGRTYWLSQAEAYLETAIRLAPGEPIAADAYALLDEFLVAGYSGSGGTHVPPDIQAKLDRLRGIAESPPGA
jgi:tetratricopeptide (TPR) repeat protein